MSTLGWLASVSSSVYVMTSLIQSIIEVPKTTDWVLTNWQYTLIMLGFLLITISFNTWGAKILPMMETVSLFGHMAGLIIVIVPLVVMCPKNSAKQVFREVTNNGGWGDVGTSCLVTQVSVLYCNLGSDSAVHICEYLQLDLSSNPK
jgi:choline transport protein